MEPTKPEQIRQFLRDLGDRVRRPVRFAVGGSGALILKGFLSRRTQDIDVVDELPPEIRALGTFLHDLEKRYRLQLLPTARLMLLTRRASEGSPSLARRVSVTLAAQPSISHFQSHYLPAGWEQRVHSLEPFGLMNVCAVDVYDVFLSKLCSSREKDQDDLRVLAPQLDRESLVRRLKENAGGLLLQADLRPKAEHNWYILYGEPLPS